MNTTLTLLWALCATPLLAAQSFTFVDRTVEVGLRRSIDPPWISKHEVAIFDQHLSGGAIVDLDGDDYPEFHSNSTGLSRFQVILLHGPRAA